MTRGIVCLYNKKQIANVEICRTGKGNLRGEKDAKSHGTGMPWKSAHMCGGPGSSGPVFYYVYGGKRERMEERAQETKDIREFLP